MKPNKPILLSVIIIFAIFIIFLISFVAGKSNNEDIPSKCYSNLKPKPFLSNGKGLIIENHLENLVKIEIFDREFRTTQSLNTGSMRPTISDIADLIEIIPLEEDLGVGDIIVFDCNDKSIRHRIIKIENGIYTTKGDNNNVEDDCLVKFENINYKVVGIIY